MARETVVYTLPAYWACYLINGDLDGLTKLDKAEADNFLAKNNLPTPISCSEEASFKWSNDANNIGGDTLEFTFLVEIDEDTLHHYDKLDNQ